MKISEVLSFLEKKYPLSYQEDFDNCGIQCGDKEREITGVLVCFEMSEETIDEAIRLNANLVISHHPLILRKGIFKIEPVGRVGKVICKALENKMVLYSMHTNLDSAVGGVNDTFADKLGLENVTVLSPIDGEPGVGLGRIGDLPEAIPAKVFLLRLKEALGLQMVRYYGNIDGLVRRVAVLGGGGSGIPVYRKLQRLGIPFAAGVLSENDLDVPTARALAEVLITDRAFERVCPEKVDEALRVMENCGAFLCTTEIGEMNRECERLLAAAETRGIVHIPDQIE